MVSKVIILTRIDPDDYTVAELQAGIHHFQEALKLRDLPPDPAPWRTMRLVDQSIIKAAQEEELRDCISDLAEEHLNNMDLVDCVAMLINADSLKDFETGDKEDLEIARHYGMTEWVEGKLKLTALGEELIERYS